MRRKVTFDTPPPPGTINFGIGQPTGELLPAQLIRDAANSLLANTRPNDLNYGPLQGDPSFRSTLAGFLSQEYGTEVTPDSLLVSAGNSQALDFVCSVYAQAGDTILVEEPSYFLAFRIFEDHGLKIVSVPTDQDGMDIDALEQALTRNRPKLLYTIPSYQNPGGQTLSAERRQRLVALSREHGFTIIADEVYQLLWYRQPPPPALGTLTGEGAVLSLGSFSKIMAPGLRLGWIQTSPDHMARLLESGVVNSGGAFNQFTSLVLREAIANGSQEAFLQRLRETFARRVEVMDCELQRHFAGRARWLRPEGGYFFWLEFEQGFDAVALRRHAADYRSGFQPGANFSADGGLRNCMRLSFAWFGEEDIREGVARLARLVDERG